MLCAMIHSGHKLSVGTLYLSRGPSWKHGQNVLSKRVPLGKDENDQSTPGEILDDEARVGANEKSKIENIHFNCSSYLLWNNGFL